LVRTGDEISLDVPNRRLDLIVDDAELERRRTELILPEPQFERGYGMMFSRSVQQAHQGADFDFLVGRTPLGRSKVSF
jgi:dihydroxy-acid dehydratase